MFTKYSEVLTNLPTYCQNIFRKDYFPWLLKQCLGWGLFSYALLAFNFILQVISLVTSFNMNPLLAIITFIGGNLSVACVIGISNRSGIQGWAGLISALCIACAAYLAGNFATVCEQIGYIIFLDIFCILDPQWNSTMETAKIESKKEWFSYLAFFLIAWLACFNIFNLTSDPRVFLDSLTLAMAITGSLMELNRKREQYYIWTLASIFTIALWAQTMVAGDGNFALIFSYSIFLLNDFYAFFSVNGWFREQSAPATVKTTSTK